MVDAKPRGDTVRSHGVAAIPVDSSIILQPNDFSAASGIIGEISRLGAALSPSDDVTRLALIDAARSLERALENPRDTLIRHTYGHSGAFAAITVGVEAGVWAFMAKDDNPKSIIDISTGTGVEPAILSRLLKHVAAMGYINETGPNEYRSSNFTKALADKTVGAGYSVFSRNLNRPVYALPEFLAQNGYKSLAGNFQYAYSTKLGLFEWLQENPAGSANFNNFMVACSHGRPFWTDEGFYPVRERLINGFGSEGEAHEDNSQALLVDVGGGVGKYLNKFCQKFPAAKGRLVLQDLGTVLQQAEYLDERIEPMAYDFFTPQPVIGARAYYMHSILHDWPDEACLRILGNVKAAMRPAYSRLLINEKVIPETAAQWEATGLDIMMACLLSSKERTQVEWADLLDRAGFQITKTYRHSHGLECVIECSI